ncbi:MAG: glycosyltransferase family 39 protein [Rhodopirellula sp.]|nr:glycosyltransferase family 39 protein [Rhodopirellula sp.]
MKTPTAKHLAIVLLLALILRLLAAWGWHARVDGGFRFGDSVSYWHLAREVAAGEPYRYGEDGWIFRTPGYPMLLAPIFWIVGPEASGIWGRILGAVFGTASVAGVWWLGRRLFNPWAGLLAASIAAVYPGAIVTSVLILSEAPFCPLMLAQLALWVSALQSASMKRSGVFAFSAGLVGGMATLVRPSWLLFTPFAVAAGLLFAEPRRRNLAIGVLALLGVAAAMAPWWIRNAQLTGHFVATSLQVGASLYDGLNPRATGASDMEFVGSFVKEERRTDRRQPGDRPASFEYRLDRRMLEAATRWAREHPGRVAELAFVKLMRMWNVWPNEASLSSWPVRIVILVSYLPVLLLGVVGAVRTVRCGLPYLLCWLPAVYFTCLHVVFVSSIRYRQPAMLGLIVLAAGVIWEAFEKREFLIRFRQGG